MGVAGLVFWRRFNARPPAHGGLYPADLLNYYYPRGEAVAQRLLAGELPLWNPRSCAGLPELATAQTAVLSPLTWLFAALPPEVGLPLRVLAECLLGGAFAALWLRRLGLDAFAAALGGALFLSTCLLGQSFWPPVVSTLAWLPAQLLCVEALAQRWRWRAWLGLVASTALQALAGFPQFALYSLQLVAAYALVRTLGLRGFGARALAPLGGVAAAVALGLGVAGAQLLPTAELAARSARAEALDPEQIHYLGDHARAASALRNAVDPAPKLLTFDYMGGGNYLGIATLLLLALGAATGPPLLTGSLLGLAALALLLSDGYQGAGAALYRLYAELPFVGHFRTPERLRIVTLVCAIALACIGLDRLGRTAPVLPRRRLAAASAAVIACAAGIAAVGAPGAAWRAAAALLGMAGAAAAGSRPALRRTAQALLFALAIGDVLQATAAFGSLRSLPLAWTDRFHVLGHTILDAAGYARLREQAGWQRVEVEQAYPSLGAGALSASERLLCLEPLIPRAWAELPPRLDPIERGRIYDAASVIRIVSFAAADYPELLAREYPRFEQRFQRGEDPVAGPPRGLSVRILSNPDALPRAYWIGHATVRSPEQALAHVKRGDLDLHTTVMLDGDPGLAVAAQPAPLRPAEILAYTPERVEIGVEAPRAGVLVLTDTWYPGWRATRNGSETEILRANGLFRAVVVPAGASRVVFEYRPRSFRLGLVLSALSLASALAIPLVALGMWRRRAE